MIVNFPPGSRVRIAPGKGWLGTPEGSLWTVADTTYHGDVMIHRPGRTHHCVPESFIEFAPHPLKQLAEQAE